MATANVPIKSFAEAEVTDEVPVRTRQGIYDWPTLFDGKGRNLISGTHFTCKPESFRMAVYAAAKQAKVEVITQINGNTFFVKRKDAPESSNGSAK